MKRGGGGLPGRNGLGASWEGTYLLGAGLVVLEIFEYYYFLMPFLLFQKKPHLIGLSLRLKRGRQI